MDGGAKEVFAGQDGVGLCYAEEVRYIFIHGGCGCGKGGGGVSAIDGFI